ncbi:hypothetical protein K466DRAFT_169122 [Polyporus arcularius HHB13444]|uniref:Uncharacterized protein n=1 Tax=Polyporus arcularius HHB13444 TaxID=1314778 RepID=A0A5C3PYU0_9APHY|nr:hypothetical protein K466DRAFT_169122 [Polyporus arcularius HHB13444]
MNTPPEVQLLELVRDSNTLSRAKERGSRPGDDADSTMPKHLFDGLVSHLRMHLPTEVCYLALRRVRRDRRILWRPVATVLCAE